MNKAILVLESGEIFNGRSVGSPGERMGEVVFNTSMTGYQEILSDPSYKGQIVVMTYPHIGNYGTNDEDMESKQVWLQGFAMGECCTQPSNFRSTQSLDSFMDSNQIVAIDRIDTRKLTRLIRDKGAIPGIISTVDFSTESLIKKLKNSAHPINGKDLVSEVTCTEKYQWNDDNENVKNLKVAVYDFGIKYNILRMMAKNGISTEVFSATHDPEEILKGNFDGVFLSNGPGDPEAVEYAVKNVKHLLGKIPMFGICLGNQIMGLALGGKTKKLKFGHHGSNQPVMEHGRGKVEITAQNHNFVLDMSHMPDVSTDGAIIRQSEITRVKESHKNLNDQSLEGLECLDIPAFSVQYHPESSPGPHDSEYLFRKFVMLMEKNSSSK